MWMFSAVLSPRLLLVTMSEGGTLSLWSSSTGELKSQTHLSGLQGETPTSSVLIQRQGRMTGDLVRDLYLWYTSICSTF